MMAHALGNPLIWRLLWRSVKYNLWLVEGNCDALGCSYSMPRPLAEFGCDREQPGLNEGPNRVVRWTGGATWPQGFYLHIIWKVVL